MERDEYDTAYMWTLKKDRNEPIYNIAIDLQT